MTKNDIPNPFTKPVYELENIQFDVRCLTSVLFDFTDNGHSPDHLSLHFIAGELNRRSERLDTAFNQLFKALVDTRDLLDAALNDKEGM